MITFLHLNIFVNTSKKNLQPVSERKELNQLWIASVPTTLPFTLVSVSSQEKHPARLQLPPSSPSISYQPSSRNIIFCPFVFRPSLLLLFFLTLCENGTEEEGDVLPRKGPFEKRKMEGEEEGRLLTLAFPCVHHHPTGLPRGETPFGCGEGLFSLGRISPLRTGEMVKTAEEKGQAWALLCSSFYLTSIYYFLGINHQHFCEENCSVRINISINRAPNANLFVLSPLFRHSRPLFWAVHVLHESQLVTEA